jgi:hypothetical protein
MQRNPYWPLNGPSFFSVLEFLRCVFFFAAAKGGVGFGPNLAARMASRRPNFPKKRDVKLTLTVT